MGKAPKRGHGVDTLSDLMSACPGGTSENSPAIHRGVNRWRMISSPVGTIEENGDQSSLRDSDGLQALANPGINAWAMVSPSLRDERHRYLRRLLHARDPSAGGRGNGWHGQSPRQYAWNNHQSLAAGFVRGSG